MATITTKKNRSERSVQESEDIATFSGEPFFISDTVLNTFDFDSIEFAADSTTFTAITAYNEDRTTYDYLAQCNLTVADTFDKGDSPLTSPFGFASVTLATGKVKCNR